MKFVIIIALTFIIQTNLNGNSNAASTIHPEIDIEEGHIISTSKKSITEKNSYNSDEVKKLCTRAWIKVKSWWRKFSKWVQSKLTKKTSEQPASTELTEIMINNTKPEWSMLKVFKVHNLRETPFNKYGLDQLFPPNKLKDFYEILTEVECFSDRVDDDFQKFFDNPGYVEFEFNNHIPESAFNTFNKYISTATAKERENSQKLLANWVKLETNNLRTDNFRFPYLRLINVVESFKCGNATAMWILGKISYQGLYKLRPNKPMAIILFAAAAHSGHTRAQTSFEKMLNKREFLSSYDQFPGRLMGASEEKTTAQIQAYFNGAIAGQANSIKCHNQVIKDLALMYAGKRAKHSFMKTIEVIGDTSAN